MSSGKSLKLNLLHKLRLNLVYFLIVPTVYFTIRRDFICLEAHHHRVKHQAIYSVQTQIVYNGPNQNRKVSLQKHVNKLFSHSIRRIKRIILCYMVAPTTKHMNYLMIFIFIKQKPNTGSIVTTFLSTLFSHGYCQEFASMITKFMSLVAIIQMFITIRDT